MLRAALKGSQLLLHRPPGVGGVEVEEHDLLAEGESGTSQHGT